jgi:predicted NodU family carbamoyl transferase
MSKPIYVLGTGGSHDGSSCLLKDGKICAAIEKERITRNKHAGGNDTETIKYCLEKENITLDDIDLIVQHSPNGEFEGPRIFENNCHAPTVSISHHLAHAYSAYGTSGFDECAVFVLDGCGSPLSQCTDMTGNFALYCDPIPSGNEEIYLETNSYYHFKDGDCRLICKEASRLFQHIEDKSINTYTENSIGNCFASASAFCFKDFHDAGKLMGLAPFGDPSIHTDEAFFIKDGVMVLNQSLFQKFTDRSASQAHFKKNFKYYADIASWAQRELERGVFFLLNSRYEMFPSDNLAYCGGVALNAVINSKILSKSPFKKLYIQPAAGDNGIAIGCAYYGWLNVMKKPGVLHESSTCFGKIYTTQSVKKSVQNFHNTNPTLIKAEIDKFFYEAQANYKKDKLRKDNVVLQLNIKNAGIYQIGITQEGMKIKHDIIGRPTSEVSVYNTDFYELIQNPGRLNRFLNERKFIATDFAEFIYWYDLIDFDLATKKTRRINTQDHFKYIHFEGEGYIEETARLLAKGKIIGWFQDESEFGPRALGRRSILADPRKEGARDFINAEIKFREDFRPFAPSVLREDVRLFFEEDMESPYMLMTNKIRSEWKERIGEVVHVDKSCRVQTVTPDWNPKYFRLLSEFKRITGISVLLNTSFNGTRMPIVETPEDALKFFYSGKLDYLVMQDLIIKRDVSGTGSQLLDVSGSATIPVNSGHPL